MVFSEPKSERINKFSFSQETRKTCYTDFFQEFYQNLIIGKLFASLHFLILRFSHEL